MNLQDDHLAIFFGPHVEELSDPSPPFYITLNIHDKFLHNCLLNFGASHNLMPKVVMDKLGLDITTLYHDLYSFDSKIVKSLGLIKDLVVILTQLPMKSVVMDIMATDIPSKFCMLLSRSWTKKLGVTIQMDWPYATIPMFGGEHKRLYKEVQMVYVTNDHKNPENHPIYVSNEYMGSCMLYMSDDVEIRTYNVSKYLVKQVESV